LTQGVSSKILNRQACLKSSPRQGGAEYGGGQRFVWTTVSRDDSCERKKEKSGDYPLGKYIEISQEVRAELKPETVMIANIGDFGPPEGKRLKEAGYTGIYHAVRMGEGRDTRIDPEVRFKSIKAARDAGLLVGTCVEPIGPEHSVEEVQQKHLLRETFEGMLGTC